MNIEKFYLSKEDVAIMWADIVKYFAIWIIIHVIKSIGEENYNNLFNETFLYQEIGLVFGFIIYHVAIKKLTL